MSNSTTASATATASQNPPKWHAVYRNDNECRFFKELSRGAFDWRTSDALAKKIGISVKEVEKIIQHYLPSGVVQQHSKEPGKFRYWERTDTKKKKVGSIAEEGQKKRVDDVKTTKNP